MFEERVITLFLLRRKAGLTEKCDLEILWEQCVAHTRGFPFPFQLAAFRSRAEGLIRLKAEVVDKIVFQALSFSR